VQQKKGKNSNKKKSKNSMKKKKSGTQTTAQKKVDLSKTASGKKTQAGTLQDAEEDGGSWTTVSKKKKKKNSGASANAKQSDSTTVVAIPSNNIGILIGAKGAMLRSIEEKSGCRVDMPGGGKDAARGKKMSNVRLTGNGSQRQLGQAIIKDLVELGFSPRLMPGMKVYKVAIPASLLPLLRGNKFRALRALEEDANVKIALPDAPAPRLQAKARALNVQRKILPSWPSITTAKSRTQGLPTKKFTIATRASSLARGAKRSRASRVIRRRRSTPPKQAQRTSAW